MCGSYIHGRSWIDETVWKHFCEPMTINAHNEMPMPASRDEMQIPRNVAKAISDAYRHKESVRDFPFFNFSFATGVRDTIYPIESNPGSAVDLPFNIDEYRIDLREVKGIESRYAPASQEGREFFLVRDMKPTHLIDWGLRPWNGTIAIQRGPKVDSAFSRGDTLTIERFLPKTRFDLTNWTRAHWGKRGDGGEFMKKMPGCLDYEKLRPHLPVKILYADSNRRGDQVLTIDRQAVGIMKDFELSFDTPDCHVAYALSQASDPCDRFCEMFAGAPNAFWAGRN